MLHGFRFSIEADPAGHRSRVPEYQAGTLRQRDRKSRHLTGLTPVARVQVKELDDRPRFEGSGEDVVTSFDIGTRPDRAKSRQNPRVHENYMNQVKKKADLTFDFDFREERPENPEEVRQIQHALQRTYDNFAMYINTPPKTPDTRDSYVDQWNSLQVQLNKIWANNSTKINEPPQLFASAKWTVSFNDWVSAPQAYLTYVRD